MTRNIDEISSDIIDKIKALVTSIERKHNDTFSSRASNSYTQVLNNVIESTHLMQLVSPFSKLESAAKLNRTLSQAKPLDLTDLDELKPRLLAKLFPNPSKMQPEDYTESKRKELEFAYKIQTWLYLLDAILRIFSKFSISNWLAPLPKPAIEEEWDALEHTVTEYNNALKTIEDTQINNPDQNTSTLSKLEINTITFILSYLDPIEFISILRAPSLNRSFKTKESVFPLISTMQQDGFDKSTFFYLKVNPLAIVLNKNLYIALKQLLKEGFHPAIFKTVDPQRFIQAPCVEDLLNEEPLTVEVFRDTHRVVRGTYDTNKPFIGILNSKNIPVTFYRYSTDRQSFWTNHTGDLGNLDVAELKIPVTQNTLNFNCEPSNFEKGYFFGGIQDQDIHPSFEKWQAWLALFLGYINESCRQNNGEPCDRAILADLTPKLTHIITDQFPCVDRAQYPELELPHTRPSLG